MERLQKILAAAGLGSRRQCEQLILQGRVIVDGEVVQELGRKVESATQKIYCDGELIKPEKKRWYIFYKPKGVVCTNAKMTDTTVVDFFRSVSCRLFPVGRLDKDSEGLLLVTNDGDFSQRLSHPSFQVKRVYLATVRGYVNRETIDKLLGGVWLCEGKIKPSEICPVVSQHRFSKLRITLYEGKNREIRRIFAKVKHPVISLVRIQFGIFTLGNLRPGEYRTLRPQEIASLSKKPRQREKSNKKRR